MYGQGKSSELSPKKGVSGSPIPPTAKALGILGLRVMKKAARQAPRQIQVQALQSA